MSQIGARSAYLALRDFDPANVSCGSEMPNGFGCRPHTSTYEHMGRMCQNRSLV
jgi:hypothetical protein